MRKDYYGAMIDQMPPEVIAANGGRTAMIKKWKKFDRKQGIVCTLKDLFGAGWGLTKAVILLFTVLYFVNALFF